MTADLNSCFDLAKPSKSFLIVVCFHLFFGSAGRVEPFLIVIRLPNM